MTHESEMIINSLGRVKEQITDNLGRLGERLSKIETKLDILLKSK